MTRALIAAAVLALAGCGVDGAPVAPPPAAGPGVQVSGSASVGVKARL